MRKHIQEIALYRYDELSADAKERVKEWYLDGQEPEIFSDMCADRLSIDFPESDLSVEYSLSYCQGDGLNIYGSLNLSDALDLVKDQLTEKEYRCLAWYIDNYGSAITLDHNRGYGYCICDRADIVANLIDDMEYNSVRAINYDALMTFEFLIRSKLVELCKEFEKAGYDYFYEISEDDLADICDANNYEFTADGNIF